MNSLPFPLSSTEVSISKPKQNELPTLLNPSSPLLLHKIKNADVVREVSSV